MMKLYLLFGLSLAMLISGILTGGGGPQLPNTGFELAPQASSSINVTAPWTGRLWARTQCSTIRGRFSCITAECGSGQVACNGAGAAPPASLVEFILAANGGQDFYDVSLVDGFDLPVSITPQGGSGPCTTTSGAANVNSVCPSDLAVRGYDGNIIGCKSACVAFNQPQYCCTGEYNSPERCQPTDYSRIFKNQCPQTYSYAYDDQSSTFSCIGAPNCLITFCP
ncbi:hypothetical protein REPUB_Repub02eG0234000 [Reevesia pubescens]